MDTYIDRYEKLEYANQAFTSTEALFALAPEYVTALRMWLLEGIDIWQTALGDSEDVVHALRDNKPALDAARGKGKQAIDVAHAALVAQAKSTGSEAELRSVFPDGTKSGVGKADLAVLSCLSRAETAATREGAPAGVAAYADQVAAAHQAFREAFGVRAEKKGERREGAGLSREAAEQWRARYLGACDAIRGLLRRHGRTDELPRFFPHLAVADRPSGDQATDEPAV